MSKKYKLTNESIQWNGRTLYRIKALKNFSNIKKGDLGGYIERENNLSQHDNCWVYYNAIVCDNARVFDEAEVYGKARVFGEARVYGNAEVFGYAKVYGDAKVCDNAKVCYDAEVYDNAEVCGDARVYGNAKVYGEAKVYDNAEVYGNAEVYDNSKVRDNSKVHDNAIVYGYARVFGNAEVCGDARVYGNAEVYGYARVSKGKIIGEITMSYKDIFQYQCENRMLTAILTENDEVLYTIGCQTNITKETFLDRIYNENGGIEKNPHRKEYLKLIKSIEMYFSEENIVKINSEL